jgi:hypothetical protein
MGQDASVGRRADDHDDHVGGRRYVLAQTTTPRGRRPKLDERDRVLAQRTRAHAIAAAEPMISVKALARRVGVSPERIRFWGIKEAIS